MIAFVDMDGYIYTFPDVPDLEDWLEPMTEEDELLIFDHDGRFYGLREGKVFPSRLVDAVAAGSFLHQHARRWPKKAKGVAQMLSLLPSPTP